MLWSNFTLLNTIYKLIIEIQLNFKYGPLRAVVVTHLVEQSLPTNEVRGSNLAVRFFCKLLNSLKREKIGQ